MPPSPSSRSQPSKSLQFHFDTSQIYFFPSLPSVPQVQASTRLPCVTALTSYLGFWPPNPPLLELTFHLPARDHSKCKQHHCLQSSGRNRNQFPCIKASSWLGSCFPVQFHFPKLPIPGTLKQIQHIKRLVLLEHTSLIFTYPVLFAMSSASHTPKHYPFSSFITLTLSFKIQLGHQLFQEILPVLCVPSSIFWLYLRGLCLTKITAEIAAVIVFMCQIPCLYIHRLIESSQQP